ncbi:MAG: 5-formyltetrahydrofolate cyclo-ligase [Candidatus Caldarchaeum sp.]|nr:5-formyltetrahydrofolate cyclo-ligase [Candidatus Caldarchaeum sp.]
MDRAETSTNSKNLLREKIWRLLEERQVATFPKPVHGRIPNFKGASEAANKLRSSRHYAEAKTVKVNPDSPQKPIRENVLKDGKLLVMPTPRIRQGFLLVDPKNLHRKNLAEAATISGAFRFGKQIHPKDLPSIDLMVVGSVAVSPAGWRVGKGEGYSELEYGILKMYQKVDDDVPIVTTVHDLQVVEQIEPEPFDIPVDRIYTNTKIINCPKNARPQGILWHLLSEEKINSIPLLKQLKADIF